MADHLSMRMVTAPLTHDMRAMTKRTDRATMWALREVGRRVKREARKNAPVYQGPARTAKVNTASGYGKSVEIVPGLLKNSIKSSRRLKQRRPHEYSIAVGPRGGHVHLYAAKQEARTPFMKPAYEAAVRDARELHEKAWNRAMR